MAAETQPPSDQSLPRSAAGKYNPWLIAIVVSLATFMEVLDTSIANVALTHISGGLAASQDEGTWVLTSYLVSNAVILPISGWLATVTGRKRFYMLCVTLFGVSSLMCGLSTSLGMLIFFRILQGIGGGGLAPSEQSILADSFPPSKRGQAFAVYGIAVVVAPTLGPTLGGWITDNYSWHWIFLINVPICALSLVLSNVFLSDPPAVEEDRKKALKNGIKVDYLGIGLVALGLGCLQIVLDKGQEDDWFQSDFILILTIISALSLVFLVVWELITDEPIVDIPLLKDKSFAASAVVMFITGFILLSTTQLLPQFLQTVMQYDATTAGLSLTAGGIVTFMLMPFVGALLKVVQPRYLIAFGLTVEAFACYHFSGLNGEISFRYAAFGRILQAAGLPFLFVPITTVSYYGLPPGKSNNASALINAMRNLGGSFGISLVTTLLARRSQFHHARLAESITPFNESVGSQVYNTLGMLDSAVQKQATILSYIDILWLLGICALCIVPVTLLLKNVKLGEASAGH